MKAWLLLALALNAVSLRAELASDQTWLGGTLPAEVIPRRELDIQLLNRLADGNPLWGFRLEYGAEGVDGKAWNFPPVMAYGEWDWRGSQGESLAAGVRLVALRRLRTALYAGFETRDSFMAVGEEFGAVQGLYLGDWELALNAGAKNTRESSVFEGRLGLRGPYLLYALQPGVDASWRTGDLGGSVTPQIFVNLPGDISLKSGVTLGASVPLWSFSLSYEIFPSP
jgi:hypothetical protein